MLQSRPASDLHNRFTEVDSTDEVESKLDEADRVAEETQIRLTHQEVFDKIRGKINSRPE